MKKHKRYDTIKSNIMRKLTFLANYVKIGGDMERQADNSKYENTILYLCEALGGRVLGMKKLYKLLYYVDFDRFEYKESMKTITGTTYRAIDMGPVPDRKTFNELIQSMLDRKIIKVRKVKIVKGYNDALEYKNLKEPDMEVFDKDDLTILERVINKYGKLNGNELEALTHSEAPWIATPLGEKMFFEMTFYRGTDFESN